jgi:hypothetical protein
VLQPLAELPSDPRFRLADIRGLFTDVDDTLTWEGALVPAAYAAICRARAAGLAVVPVTGRPAGWGAVIAATWPVDAVIVENGAATIRRERVAATGKARLVIEPFDAADPLATDDAARAARLEAITRDVLSSVPRARLSEDQWLRRYDVAFDVGETQALGRDEIDAIVARIRAHRAQALVSSVHAHVVLGEWDKGRALTRAARALFGDDVTVEPARSRWLFVGDSQNDEAGFAALPLSVGVANVRAVADRLAAPPAYVTPSPGGHGFAELVELLLAHR